MDYLVFDFMNSEESAFSFSKIDTLVPNVAHINKDYWEKVQHLIGY